MRIFLIFIFYIFTLIPICAEQITLNAGISVEQVPEAVFGGWRVSAKLDDTNSPKTFKPHGLDIWNLSRIENKIILTNPFNGATSEINLKTVEGNLVVFSKRASYDNKILTDTISIRITGNSFTGINSLTLESYSLVDNHLLSTEQARYLISGEKISGNSIIPE